MGEPLSAILARLRDVKRGDPITADRVNDIQHAIAALSIGDNVRQGADLLKKTGFGWFMLSGRKARGVEGVNTAGPWEIKSGTDPDTIRVATNSTLLANLSLNSEITIAGIDDDFTIKLDQVLFLQMTHDVSGNVDSVSLVADDQWDTYPDIFSTTGTGTIPDPLVVDKSYFPIGYAYKPEDAKDLEGITVLEGVDEGETPSSERRKVKVVRLCFTPLVLRYENIGAGFIVPYPSAAPRFGGDVI